jgi:nucleoside-triphosphatase THEP1
MDIKNGKLWLLTGPRAVGKTRFCAAAADLAGQADWRVAGLLSTPVFVDEEKMGICARDLASGAQCQLASKHAHEPFSVIMGEWHFDPRVLAWGNTVLEGSTGLSSEEELSRLLVVDELGPLELLRNQGWLAALPLLNSRKYRAGLVVVRPELLERATPLLPELAGTIKLEPGVDPEREAGLWWEKQIND